MNEGVGSTQGGFWRDDAGAGGRYGVLLDNVGDGDFQLDLTGWFVGVDDGVGMDPDQADRAFELFQRLHPGNDDGTGIGLALCEGIVERHSGTIQVESAPGEGTTFTVTLPTQGETDA